ncbi:SDR family oxidoreductase [Motiliproteus sediminis]|uniref:SDR family oxidoreductase n=1 Tax=Motiliproteus sediminis TaxID=1468178 RepID=UPI001AEFBBC8|nr:sugar nucleotide-binding protein [Motiliproteus sediminis]
MFELPLILVTGADGQLGYDTAALAQEDGFQIVALSHAGLDICDPAAVAAALAEHRPAYVVNAVAGFDDGNLAVNSTGAAVLAQACADAGIALVQVSCAEVFDGLDEAPYSEEYHPAPVSAYGSSKAAGEEAVRAVLPRHVILRTGWLFSARGDNIVRQLLEQARRQEEVEVCDLLMGSPTATMDLARVVLAIIKQLDSGSEGWGTYHYAGGEPISWFGFCEAVIAAARQYEDLRLERLLPVQRAPAGWRAMPLNTQLDCSRIRGTFGVHQRTWRTGLMQAMRTLHAWDS